MQSPTGISLHRVCGEAFLSACEPCQKTSTSMILRVINSKPRKDTVFPSTRALTALAFSKLVSDEVCAWMVLYARASQQSRQADDIEVVAVHRT